MASLKQANRELIDWLGQAGVNYEIQTGKKHCKVYIEHGSERRFLTVSVSPSDRRSALNQIATCRRLLREMGREI